MINDYRCHECGYLWGDYFHKKPDDEIKCPTCGKPMTKLLSYASFKINGASAANGYS